MERLKDSVGNGSIFKDNFVDRNIHLIWFELSALCVKINDTRAETRYS